MAVPMSQVLTTARTYLNDDNSTVFTDPVLIPKVQEAHRELQEELWVVGSPIVRAQTAVLTYLTPNTVLPALPGDFLCPTAIFENVAGKQLTDSGWTPMTEAIYIPLSKAQGVTLDFWSWQQESVVLLGSTQNRAVVVYYRRQVPIPAISTDPIGVLFGESYLAARSAAMAAGSVGNEPVYDKMTALAKENLAKVINANRGQQKPALRP